MCQKIVDNSLLKDKKSGYRLSLPNIAAIQVASSTMFESSHDAISETIFLMSQIRVICSASINVFCCKKQTNKRVSENYTGKTECYKILTSHQAKKVGISNK